jgi:hypothetical protein
MRLSAVALRSGIHKLRRIPATGRHFATAASGGPPGEKHGLLSKAVLILPLCFAIGLSAAELTKGTAEEDAIVERRVQQRLGIWTPPVLSAEDRAKLEQERENLRKDIAALEAKIAAKRVAGAGQ